MTFYKYNNLLLFIFVVLLLFASWWHIFNWVDFFSDHFVFAFLIIIINALIIWTFTKKFNHFIREKTLENILNDMNSHINPKKAFQKYEHCIVDWKQINSPIRIIYRFILNHPLKIWNYHLVEEISFDNLSKSWKFLSNSGEWQSYLGPNVPDETPIGECRQCFNQIYNEDLEELDDRGMELVCMECGSSDLDFGNDLQLKSFP